MLLLHFAASAYLKLYCLVLCALCVVLLLFMHLHVHVCLEYAISKCVYIVGVVRCVCTLCAAQSFALFAAHAVHGHLTFCIIHVFHDLSFA